MEEETKKCTTCLVNYSRTYFTKNKQSKDGLTYDCKKCIIEKRAKIKLNKESTKEIPSEKYCPRCETTKTSCQFASSKVTNDGLFSYCKSCRTIYDANMRKKNKASVIVDSYTIKICQSCHQQKKLTEFRVNRKCVDNFNDNCYTCDPTTNWSIDKKRIQEKKYRTDNPEKMKVKYKKDALNVNRRTRTCLNSRIKQALITNNTKKKNKTVEYIGCSIDFFKGWIQHLFQNEMSWDNHGLWHLDHVKPCVAFDLSVPEQVKECFNWKNYQPLWGIDNLIKNGRVDNELIKTHLEKANNYEKSISNILSAQVKEGELLE